MWRFLPNAVYCFNYHRIGDEEKSLFDPNVFSCTAEVFEQHLEFYNQEFTVISVEQLIDKIEANEVIDKKYAVITFDDGYIDNYTVAFPLLKKHQTPAAFYIATDYLDEPHIPWWDEVAWLVRHSNINTIKLKSWQKPVDISKGSIVHKVRAVLREIKQEQERTMADKIAELEVICQCRMPEDLRASSLFMNWQQAKEMSDNNMHIGSHTLSHTILSHLSEAVQETEITKSKAKIEAFLKKETTSIAYPVGGKNAFTTTTQALAKKANNNFIINLEFFTQCYCFVIIQNKSI
jgi:peptidoglycan/xylan/chitin deacetylase (PgdA/CDA1 family)